MSDRPVVINSLLCFLANYREQENIERVVEHYFTFESRTAAAQLLVDLLPESTTNGDGAARVAADAPALLLRLYDRVARLGALAASSTPVFVTDDLTMLPLAPSYDPAAGRPRDLYDEVRQLRIFIQNSLERKTDETRNK